MGNSGKHMTSLVGDHDPGVLALGVSGFRNNPRAAFRPFRAHDTVNRPASTGRETPLKLAVEMANAGAVTRLIELGADVEAPCDTLPSAPTFPE